jgi:protein SCO1/2
MPKKSKPPRHHSGEQVFVIVAIVGSLILGAGFCFLLFALNHHEQNPPQQLIEAVENPPSTLIAPDHPRQLVDFTLTNWTEGVVKRSDLSGKILVVSFLFTSCTLTCPAVSTEMSSIQQMTTNLPGVELVSLTVDPDDDTPDVLGTYSGRFSADTNRWLFLTGDKSQLYHLIGASFLTHDADNAFGYMPGDYAHTERIAVVDPRGQLRGYFDGLNQNTPMAVMNEINKIQNQKL